MAGGKKTCWRWWVTFCLTTAAPQLLSYWLDGLHRATWLVHLNGVHWISACDWSTEAQTLWLRWGRPSSGVSSTDARLDVCTCVRKEVLDLDRTKGRQAKWTNSTEQRKQMFNGKRFCILHSYIHTHTQTHRSLHTRWDTAWLIVDFVLGYSELISIKC